MKNKIEPITASWDCKGEKSREYRCLNMIHAMAGQSAQSNDSQWKLKATATYDDYVLTVWTNGIVDIKAESWKREGVAVKHEYSMYEASKFNSL